MEIWKSIKNHPNYEISNLGRVKSLNYKNTNKEHILKLKITRGYQYVSLNGKNHYVHRLVCSAFYGESNLQCDHLNENKLDNRLENLRWLDRHNNFCRSHSTPVILTNIKTGEEKLFRSQKEASEYLGSNIAGIGRILTGYGNRKICKGHTVRYANVNPSELYEQER